MPKFLTIAVELTPVGGTTIYFSTHRYRSAAGDTPASLNFRPRLVDQIEFDRSVGCALWGEQPRGKQNFGVIKIANSDGAFDSYVGVSLRDAAVVIKRGYSTAAYSTFSTVANLIVDKAEFTNELILALYVTDISALLERSLQDDVYPITISNSSLVNTPRPITFGRCYQVPLSQPETIGNGHFDFHDNKNFVGVEQLLDTGITLIESVGYKRSSKSGIFGIERLSAIQSAQAATVLGAFKIISTEITENFASLASWTETNGGAANRDATISSNQLRLTNTAGGSDLSLAWSASTPTGTDATYWFYEFSCTNWVSGYAQLRFGAGAIIQEVIDKAGSYAGIIRLSGNAVPAFYAISGSNCDLYIDNFRLRKVTPMETLLDAIKFVATNDTTTGGHGPLTLLQIDSSAITALETAAPYSLGFHINQPIQIADVLDQIMTSFTGWWYVNRLGLLTVGRLSAPAGSPVFSFDENSIESGMAIALDQAKNLSDRALGKKNYFSYDQSEIAGVLRYVQNNNSDKSANVTLSYDALTDTYQINNTGTGSVRSTPPFFGDRYYFEIYTDTINTDQMYIGMANTGAAITNYPGASAHSIAYRADGDLYVNGSATGFGSSYTGGDTIGVAIDGRSAAYGSKARGFRIYFSVNGLWQVHNPNISSTFSSSADNAFGVAYAMLGNAESGNQLRVNYGQNPFFYTQPAEYSSLTSHATNVCAAYRDNYQSSVPLADAYAFARVSETLSGSFSNSQFYLDGIPTLLNKRADLQTECDRWCGIYGSERFFYSFNAFLQAEDADTLEPGDIISVTYPRYGLSNKLLCVVSVTGRLLDTKVSIVAWG